MDGMKNDILKLIDTDFEAARREALQIWPSSACSIIAARNKDDLRAVVLAAQDFAVFDPVAAERRLDAPIVSMPVPTASQIVRLFAPIAATGGIVAITWAALDIGAAIVSAIVAQIALIQSIVAGLAGLIIVIMVFLAIRPAPASRIEKKMKGDGDNVVINHYYYFGDKK